MVEEEALLIEIVGKTTHTNFTDYEFYVGIIELKLLHEKEYSNTNRGKYDRSSFKNKDPNGNDQETITEKFSFMPHFKK